MTGDRTPIHIDPIPRVVHVGPTFRVIEHECSMPVRADNNPDVRVAPFFNQILTSRFRVDSFVTADSENLIKRTWSSARIVRSRVGTIIRLR